MTKEEFVAQLDRAAATNAALPVTSALLRTLGELLKKGDPPWWRETLKAWEKRSFVAWSEAWGLFLTCVHFEALNDAECELGPYFPSCGGTDEADPTTVFARFLNEAPRSFFARLREGQRRTYVEQRAPMWIAPAMGFFQRRGLPFYLVEVNAGGGLNLAADLVLPQRGFDSELVAARIGLDKPPLQLEDINDRRWLTAAIMPDQTVLIPPLDRAIELVTARLRKEAAFLQMVPCAAEQAAKFIAKNIPSDDKDVGLLVMNMGTTVRMTDAAYESYRSALAEMMKPWGDRALWVEFENVRGEMFSTTYQVRVGRVFDGRMAQQVLASFDMGTKNSSVNEKEGLAFLGAGLPAQ